MNISHTSSDRLPLGCQIRPAKLADRWQIQNLLRGLIKSEGLNFEVRLFGYYLVEALIWGGLAGFCWQFLDRLDGIVAILVMIAIALLILIALFRLLLLCLSIVFLFISGAKNWSKYVVVECNRALVACMAMRRFQTHTIIYNLYVKPSWRSQGLGSALVNQARQAGQSSANRPIQSQNMPENATPISPETKPQLRNSRPTGRRSVDPVATNDLYLVCKPRLVGFYTRLGFVSVTWQKLPDRVKSSLNGYRPHPRLWGFQVAFMRWRSTNSINAAMSNLSDLTDRQ
ncbi:GCN5-related N-acetyltransferase [Thalassoporum mexicanum PCC 7367]|uniref:GNAT family N-acetyltransferase n=1 Tax=Thalassoporum mexicanum TaxID=3457544 RepID=UPI00029FFC80|nr:GNAT family N-acetyltransferase [Pseudanabaena sp. PCC 7367]AFY71020.1 GCN5-related N-acetyltransferase [Pseudanabaena sp. PCC 7367]